jgi:hypothetical protein
MRFIENRPVRHRKVLKLLNLESNEENIQNGAKCISGISVLRAGPSVFPILSPSAGGILEPRISIYPGLILLKGQSCAVAWGAGAGMNSFSPFFGQALVVCHAALAAARGSSFIFSIF